MRIAFIISIILFAGLLFAGDIIPVKSRPKSITTVDKVICNPTIDQCVAAGYRLLEAKPATPEGKQIKSEKIIQDPDNATKCKYEIVYEDLPAKPVIVPDVLTNVSADKVQFSFTTNGQYRGVIWLDAPKTNKVEK